MHELRELALITAYLYVTLGAVILLKSAVLHSEGIEFAPWGLAIIKALILGKFVLIGHALRLGERFSARPLIWPTMHKSISFLVLLTLLTAIEEVLLGVFHHKTAAATLREMFGPRLQETLAELVIMLLVLIPYFAFRVLGEALGGGRLARMFFVGREPTPGALKEY